MFAKFFRPKWQNNKPEIRIKAIASLQEGDSEEQQILIDIALTDHSPEVRSAATARLSQPELLLRISNQEKHQHARKVAIDRLCKAVTGELGEHPVELRRQWLQQVTDSDLLTHIALRAEDALLREAAIAQIADQHCLETIVLKAQSAALRKAASEKLTNQEILERISRYSRNKDKAVYRIMRAKLAEIREQQLIAQALEQRYHNILSQLQQMTECSWFPQYPAKITALETEWRQLSKELVIDLNTIDELLAFCKQRIEQQNQQQQQLQQAQLAAEQQQQIAEQFLRDISAYTEQQRQQLQNEQLDLKALSAKLSEIATQWLLIECNDDGLNHNFGQLTKELQLYAGCQKWLNKLQRMLAEGAKSDISYEQKVKLCKKITQQLQQPEAENSGLNFQSVSTAKSLLQQLEQVIGEQQQQLHQTIIRTEQAFTELEEMIAAGQASDAEKQLNRCYSLLEQLPAQQRQRFIQTQAVARAKVTELKDWQGYAVQAKKTEICDEMEALIDQDVSIEQRVANIKQLQQLWKQLDETDPQHDQNLWRRFKKASDLAYEPCQQHYDDQRQRRQYNLQQRITICEQLEHFLAISDMEAPDWDAVENISHTAKQEWRQFTPVDRAPGKKVQHRFNQLLETLDQPLKQHRESVADAKRVLIEQMQQLSEQTDNLPEATDTAKELQQQWKAAGRTFRSLDKKLWEEFRSYSDTLFDNARNTQRQQRQQQRKRNGQAEEACQLLESMPDEASLSLRMSVDTKASHLFERLDDQGRKEHQQRFERAMQRVRQPVTELKEYISSSAVNALTTKIEICDQLERGILAGTSQVNAVTDINEQWQQAGAVPPEFHEMIEHRLELATSVIEDPSILPELQQAAEEHLHQLCIQLEIELKLDSPDEDHEQRMAIQLQRLQQAIAQHHQDPDLTDLKKHEHEWRCVPLWHAFDQLEQRFYRSLSQVLDIQL